MDRIVAINEKRGTAEELLDLFRDTWIRVKCSDWFSINLHCFLIESEMPDLRSWSRSFLFFFLGGG